ncbi:hypothetical protein C1N62_08060 [Nissabacter sp. SGAir0207]|nr:hypothetical protein C1N62_08060 [Nissabacter sp. SGAir0207]
MGVALHIVLFLTLELLHSTFNSYQPVSDRLFFASYSANRHKKGAPQCAFSHPQQVILFPAR